MPRKGKSDLINEDNLIQSKKILDDIVKLLMKAEDAQKDSAQQFNIKKQIFAQLERYAEISNKNLNRYNITLSSTFSQLENVVDIFRESLDLQEQQNSRVDERLKQLEEENKKLEQQKQLYQKLDSDMAKYKQKMTDISNLKYKSPVQKLKDSLNDQLSQTQQSISDMTDSIIQKHKKNGTYTQENLGMIQNEIKNTLKDSGLTDQLGKVNVTMTILNETLGVIKGALSIITGGIKRGINAQSGVYERTYQDISTRTGTDNPTYFRNQANTYNNLISQGLADNIKVSDVQQMWDTMAKTGSNEQDMYANAIENVITKNVVPYLDTTSKSFTILNNRFDGNFTKQIRGINAANLEIAGNNYTTQDMMQTIIDQIQPMSDKAVEDLAQGSAEVTAMINKMIDQGWSEDAAKSYATQLFKSQRYGDQIMRSGSVSEKYAMISAIDQGVNIYDPTQYNDFMGLAVDTDKMLMSGMPGYNSTLNGMITNFGGTAMGIDFGRAYGAMYAKGSGNQLANDSNLTPAQLAEFARREQERLKNNETQTSLYRQETTLQNLGTYLAISKEYMGKYYDLLVSILGAVKNITLAVIGAKIGGNILKGIGGKGIGSGVGAGIGSALTSFAGTTLGYQAMGVGASMGINSVPLATAAGVALPATIAAAGVAGGAYGISKGVEDINKGKHQVRGATSVASGAAMAAGGIGVAGGMLAAGAANAWNPIGWGLLIAGTVGVAATAIHRAATEHAEMLEYSAENLKNNSLDVAATFDGIKENLVNNNNQTIESLKDIKTQIDEGKNLTIVRNELLQSGLLTEEEEQNLRDMTVEELYDNKQALIDLTNQYIKSTEDMNSAGTELLDMAKAEEQENKGKAVQDIVNWLDVNQNYKDGNVTYDDNNALVNALYNQVITKRDSGGTLTEQEEKFLKKIDWADRDNDRSLKDIRAIYKEVGGIQSFARMLDAETLRKISRTNGSVYGENMSAYSDNSLNENIINILANAAAARDKATAVSYLNQAGYDPGSKYKEYIQRVLDNKEWGIRWDSKKAQYYRQGTDSIPYDGFPAILHQGEAVLTASTANEMRGLVDEYRDSKNESSNFDVIIESQTVAIIDKMDEIIAIMNNNSSTITESTARSFVNSAKDAQINNMIRMKNSKSLA